MPKLIAIILSILIIQTTCITQPSNEQKEIPFAKITPRIITDTTKWDTDDPAIWIHPTDPDKSLIIGTDKNTNGALYVFDLKGKIVNDSAKLNGPNNVDVAYGFSFNGETIDIAVVTERLEQRIRVFRLPEMEPIDSGDLIVFEGDTDRAPMGIALYKRKRDSAFFIFVGGKSGPPKGYIGQYRLEEDPVLRKLKITLVRQFGKFSGIKEIEAIAVDNELGYVYYSDETVGVRKYHADPDADNADVELALFADQGFTRDHEGISIYKLNDGTGYIMVSDQQANLFRIFSREGSPGSPHDHRLVKIIETDAIQSDGNDVASVTLSPDFISGLFVAMSDYLYYKLDSYHPYM